MRQTIDERLRGFARDMRKESTNAERRMWSKLRDGRLLSGAIAGFAGWLLAARTAGATANLGVGMLFNAFAAVVIGGVSLKGGYGRLSGVFAGVLLLSSISTAINVWGMPPHYTQIIRGALVLVAVILDTVKTSIRRRYL